MASIWLHVLLLAALFLVPALAGEPPAPRQRTSVRADPTAEDPLEPPLPPPDEIVPEVPVTFDSPEVVDPPPEDFPDVPDDAPPALRDTAVSDLPWSRSPRLGPVIGVGGGAGGRPRSAPPPVLAPPPAPPPAPAGPTVDAVVERRLPPRYPSRAVERGLQGAVVLLIEVRPDGTVGEIRVERSSGHALLDDAAIEAVRGWEFRPARVNGEPVRSWAEQRFTFRFDE